MFESFLMANVYGFPLFVFGGLLPAIFFTITLVLGLKKAPMKTHMTFAIISMVLGVIHGIISIIAFL